MKMIMILICLLGLGSTGMASDLKIECADNGSATFIRHYSPDQGFPNQLQLQHNFSSAALQCDLSTVSAVKNNKIFRCAGLWNFDIHRPDETVGTVAVVEFTPTRGQEWSASFITSHDYGRQPMTVGCTITQ